MNRDEFLEMCKAVAVLPEGVGGVKTVPPELQINYNGLTFYPIGYTLTFAQNGKPLHTAILHDLKTKSISNCDLLKVERKEQNETDNFEER